MINPACFRKGWSLGDERRGYLIRLGQALRSLASKARRGHDLIALGEAWEAVEQILNGQAVEVDVGLSVGFRRGNRDFEEGLFMCCRINDDEIVLDELNTSYSSGVGSDHHTNGYARFQSDGSFDTAGVNDWLDKLEEVQRFDDAELDSERNHV
jgi:hypothetical protein